MSDVQEFYNLHDRVLHDRFGEGIVIYIKETPPGYSEAVILVEFDNTHTDLSDGTWDRIPNVSGKSNRCAWFYSSIKYDRSLQLSFNHKIGINRELKFSNE